MFRFLVLVLLCWSSSSVLFTALSTFSVEAKECRLQAQRNLPVLFVAGEGDAKSWKVEYGHDFSSSYELQKRARAALFKLGRIKGHPVFSWSFMSLDGKAHSKYYPNKKNLIDRDNSVYGIFPEDLAALEFNYNLMNSFYRDRLKSSIYFRYQEMLFAALTNPFMVRTWNEVYRKTEDLGLKNGNTVIRTINNVISHVTRERPILWKKVRMGSGYKIVKKIFDLKVRKVFEDKKVPIDHLRVILEAYHHHLVDRVNKKYGSQFRYFNKDNLAKGELEPYREAVNEYLVYGFVEALKSGICNHSTKNIVFVLLPEKHHQKVLDLLRQADDRLTYEVFRTLNEDEVQRMYANLAKRKVI